MKPNKTLFTKMLEGEIPCVKIYEDEKCCCIVDKFPTTKGQCLIFPKKEVDYVMDLDDETYHHIFAIAKKVGKACDQSLSPKRTCIVVEGFEVPHVHIKLLPTWNNILETSGGTEISQREMEELAEKIKSKL